MSLFTAEEREAAAARLVAALGEVAGVARVFRLGSTTSGTADRHSDIDIAVVIAPNAEVAQVAAQCTDVALRLLPVFHHFAEEFGGFEMRGFLLESFLEVDVGVARPGEVEAELDLPPLDVEAKLDFSWHDVIHAAAAIDRGRPWRALWYVERLRNGSLELAAASLRINAHHFAGIDELPPETLTRAEQAIPRSLSESEIWRALRAATVALFAEGRRTHRELADKLEPKLTEFIDLIQFGESRAKPSGS